MPETPEIAEKQKSSFQHPVVPATTDYIEPFELEHPDTWMQLQVYSRNPSDHSAVSSDYSGFSSSGSSASLCFSESQDGSSGFSQVLSRRDQRTQTDAFLCQTDQCVETVVPWKDVGFRCKCSNRAPKPLSEARRAAIACREFRPRRRDEARQKRKVSSSLESMSGTWALESQFIGIAQSFMHRLTFVGDRCIDARGQKWKVTQEGNNFFLIKGRIWTSGGVLFREGKSGIVMRFQPEEEDADPFEFAEDPDLNFEEEEQARPLLRDAGRLYKAERESSPKMNLLDKEEEWQLALACCEILTFELEAEVCHMLESPADEVKKILLKAVQHSLRVQASPAATTRLQRLVFGLRCRLLGKACPNEDAA
eukprot:s60_g10.t1